MELRNGYGCFGALTSSKLAGFFDRALFPIQFFDFHVATLSDSPLGASFGTYHALFIITLTKFLLGGENPGSQPIALQRLS